MFLGFYRFWCTHFRLLFDFFGVILSSLISHIARCASRRLDAVRNKSQTRLTFLLSPFTIFVSFFNLQKHTRKKNENQLDIIFRTTLKRVTEHLDDVFHKRMVITHCKHLCEGDYLIDDRGKNGASEFKGEWIQFGSDRFADWKSVLSYLLG